MIKTEIAVHCSATPPHMDIGAATIRRWHLARGWRDIGYNAVIRRNGKIEAGRDLDGDGDYFEEIGAHVKGHNRNSIGVCLIGGVDKKGRPDANFTRAQYVSLEKFINEVQSRYGEDVLVKGHRDYPNVNKACPSFDVSAWWYG